MAIALRAQAFTGLHGFHGPDGQGPYAGLIQSPDGNLYGTTFGWLSSNVPFRVRPKGPRLSSRAIATGCGEARLKAANRDVSGNPN